MSGACPVSAASIWQVLTDEMLSRTDKEGRQLGLEIESIGGKRQPQDTSARRG